MISEEELTEVARLSGSLLGRPVNRSTAAWIVERLCAASTGGLRLSVYGYFRHLLETRGEQATLNNVQKSQKSVDSYATTAFVVQQGFPQRLATAADVMHRLSEERLSLNEILFSLSRMTEPAILYFLLKFDFPGEAKKFEKDATDLISRYPGLIDVLPKDFFKESEYGRVDQRGTCSPPHCVL